MTVVWQMTCQRSHIYCCASCWHHVFVLLVQFALVHLKIEFCLAGVSFLQEDYRTLQFAWDFFSWDRCLHFSLSLLTLFVIWHSGPTWFKYRFYFLLSWHVQCSNTNQNDIFYFKIYKLVVTAHSLIFVYLHVPRFTAHLLLELSKGLAKSHFKTYQL